MRRILLVILVILVSSSLEADNYYFKIGNNHAALPFSRFAKLTYKDFHVSYELGKSFTLKKTNKYEWFQTLVQKPKKGQFVNYKREAFGQVDIRDKGTFTKSKYDSTYGLSEEEAHHIHQLAFLR